MSQRLAPGAWDPEKRIVAKLWVNGIGSLSFAAGIFVGSFVAIQPAPATVPLIFCGVLILVGLLCIVPNIAVPIAYRVIDKFMTDS